MSILRIPLSPAQVAHLQGLTAARTAATTVEQSALAAVVLGTLSPDAFARCSALHIGDGALECTLREEGEAV